MFGIQQKGIIERCLSSSQEYAYTLFRMVIGFLFFIHGAQKVVGWFSDAGPKPLFSMIGFAGIVELVGGLLVLIGLWTRFAAIASAVIMFSAGFVAHIMPMVFGAEGLLGALHWFIQGGLLSALFLGLWYGMTKKNKALMTGVMVLLIIGVIPYLFVNLLALVSAVDSTSFAAINPVVNRGEAAMLYLVAFMLIAYHGAKTWSVERMLTGKEYF